MIMSHEAFNAAVLSAYGSMVALGFQVSLLYLQPAPQCQVVNHLPFITIPLLPLLSASLNPSVCF